MESNKIREAVQFLADGDKAIQKGWFKKPEWDVAGSYYEKAASCFKAARSYEQAIQAYLKASDALFKSDSIYMAAKSMEGAANLAAQQLKQPERAAELYRQASDLYQTHMTPDRAAEMLEKAARALEPIDVDQAIDFYVAACSLYESEDRSRFAIDTFTRTIAVMTRHKRYDAAIDILLRLRDVYHSTNNNSGLNKTCLSIIIVLLAASDEIGAKRQFQHFCQYAFVQSEESAIASILLDAFEQGDQELLEETVHRQIVTYLDNEIAKLARTLQVPGDILTTNNNSASSTLTAKVAKKLSSMQPPQQQAFLWNHGGELGGGEEKEFDEDDYVSSYFNDEKLIDEKPLPVNEYDEYEHEEGGFC
ncbi:2204_t:CDS:2 [Ambispora gerdemannii]|uniref:Gamma-soluble NSF attachment protein n=1 Tax=Ambispora gerdemannii TaxID=144530 RepID=A0A9N9GJ43_9GLOM|nr:2204_t:CDS:2 [Ambispora gerdemannii]